MTEPRNPSDWSTAPPDEPERPVPPVRERFDLFTYLVEHRERDEHGDLADPSGHWYRLRGRDDQ